MTDDKSEISSDSVGEGERERDILLTVVIPTYRRQESLRAAIQSVLAQDIGFLIEILVLDDDPHSDISELKLAWLGKPIKFIVNEKNRGLWANVNQGIALAVGEWVMILPDDDSLVPDSLSQFGKIAQSNSSRPIGCLVGGSRRSFSLSAYPLRRHQNPFVTYPFIGAQSPIGAPVLASQQDYFRDTPKLCSTYFRTDQIKRLGFFDSDCEGFADLAIYHKFQDAALLYWIPILFGNFRVHSGNLSNAGKIWSTYPLRSAERLITVYCPSNAPCHRKSVESVMNQYKRAVLSDWTSLTANMSRRIELCAFMRSHRSAVPAIVRIPGAIFIVGGCRAILRRVFTLGIRLIGAVRKNQHTAEDVRYR